MAELNILAELCTTKAPVAPGEIYICRGRSSGEGRGVVIVAGVGPWWALVARLTQKPWRRELRSP